MIDRSYFLRMVGLAFIYALVAKLSLGYLSTDHVISVMWPPSGLALAALLIGGKKYWPGIFVGSLAGDILSNNLTGISIQFAAGSTLGSLLAFWLLTRVVRFNSNLENRIDFLWLGLAGALGAVVCAVIGASALTLSGSITQPEFIPSLLRWWGGDTLGIILFAPFILVWRHFPKEWFYRERILATIFFLGISFLAGQIIFLGWFHNIFGTTARGYWIFLFVTWGAVRFGLHGAVFIVAMTAIQMLLGMILQLGGATNNQVPTGLLNFWLYMLVVTTVGVALATSFENRKKLELEKIAQIRYLDIMGRISQIGAVAKTSEEMLESVLKEILSIFNADRAWFLYPCDPDATSWGVPMEHTRPEWPGILVLGSMMPINAQVKVLFENALARNECIQYGPTTPNTIPSDIAEQFSIKSQMTIALKPRIGKAWLMGLHHCSHAHLHDENDQAIFKGIADRVSDSLSSFAAMQSQRENEERFFGLFQNAPIGLFHTLPSGKILTANQATAAMLGYTSPEQLIERIADVGAQIYLEPQKRKQIIEKVLNQSSWVQDEVKLHSIERGIITANIILRKVLNPNGSLAYLEGFLEDITDRKASEAVLAESEQRFRFLNKLGETTRVLVEPWEILANITQLLGTHLQVSRCAYADVESDSNHFNILHDYTDGCASTVGSYKLSQFGPLAVSELHAGRTLVINNVDEEVSQSKSRKMFDTISIKAVICCPLLKQGKLRAMMAVHQTTARKWTPSEISLVEEVVERSWAVIERARA